MPTANSWAEETWVEFRFPRLGGGARGQRENKKARESRVGKQPLL